MPLATLAFCLGRGLDAPGDRALTSQMGACLMGHGQKDREAVYSAVQGGPTGPRSGQDATVLRGITLLEGVCLVPPGQAETHFEANLLQAMVTAGMFLNNKGSTPTKKEMVDSWKELFKVDVGRPLGQTHWSYGVRAAGHVHQRPGLLGQVEVVGRVGVRGGSAGIHTGKQRPQSP